MSKDTSLHVHFMKLNKKMAPYLLVNIAVFYLLPMVIGSTGAAMVIMLVGIPVICLVTAFVYGVRHGFDWIYCLAAAVLFAPTIFIYYNSSAWVYIIGYGLCALIGNVCGKLLYKAET